MKSSSKKIDAARAKTVSFRLPGPLMEKLRTLAKVNRRTLSGELQIAIEKHLHANGSFDVAKNNEGS
jgi:predicted DNA-binding protein